MRESHDGCRRRDSDAIEKRLCPRFETSADDVAALLAYLNIEKADLFGFSNGSRIPQRPRCVLRRNYKSLI
jgi:hypothetical protein